ncbi:hypothetical protein [Trueperella pyogenes]
MFVVVVSVLSVTVAIMQVVHVIAVLDGLMATTLAVSMLSERMLRLCFVLVVVVSVLSVTVAIVQVIDVIAVLDRLVATALAVLMFRGGMLRKLMVGHGISP